MILVLFKILTLVIKKIRNKRIFFYKINLNFDINEILIILLLVDNLIFSFFFFLIIYNINA